MNSHHGRQTQFASIMDSVLISCPERIGIFNGIIFDDNDDSDAVSKALELGVEFISLLLFDCNHEFKVDNASESVMNGNRVDKSVIGSCGLLREFSISESIAVFECGE